MKWYLGTLITLFALETFGKLARLASGNFEPVKPYHEAIDVAINLALMVWGAILLASLFADA